VQINPFALGALWLQRSSLRSGGNVPISIPVSGSFRILKWIEYYLRMRRPSHILWLTFGLDCKQQRISALRAQTIATHVLVGRSGFGYNNELRRY